MKDKTKKIDDLLVKGKKILDYFESSPLPYINPFTQSRDNFDTLDQIEVLEYSKLTEKESASITLSDSQRSRSSHVNLKEYDTILFKVEELHLFSGILNQLENYPLCIECKIPLYIQDLVSSETYYDTFKILYKEHINNTNPAEESVFHLGHVSYHQLKIEDETFIQLANSKILVSILQMKNNSKEELLARGEFSLEKIFISNDFFYTVDLDLSKIVLKNENARNGKGSVARQGKKSNQKPTNNSNQNIGLKTDLESSNLFGKLSITVQLFKSKVAKKKDQISYKNYNDIKNDEYNDPNTQPGEKINTNQKKPHCFNNTMVEENKNEQSQNENVKIDYDGLLVLYLNVGELKLIKNTSLFNESEKIDQLYHNEKNTNSNYSNLFISHKIFPNTDHSCSDIQWNKDLPNFKYHMMMPFNLTSRTIDLLFSEFVIEVWHKGREEDILLGTAKIPLGRIIEFLKVDEYSLSMTNLEKSILPLIIHDDFAPVFSYVEFTNIFFLHLTLGVGTINQVHYYMRKFNQSSVADTDTDFAKKINIISSHEEANKVTSKENLGKKFNTFNDSNNKSIKDENSHHDHNKVDADEINIINQLLNNKNETIQKENNEDLDDVENLLERNKEFINESSKNKHNLQNLNDQSDRKLNSKTEKKYNGNPFLVPTENPQGSKFVNTSNKNLNHNEESYEVKNKNEFHESLNEENSINTKNSFKVSKESNFFIKEEKGIGKNNKLVENSVLDGKLTENDFFKTGKMEKIENISIGENIPNYKNLETFNDGDKNEKNKNIQEGHNNNELQKNKTYNEIIKNEIVSENKNFNLNKNNFQEENIKNNHAEIHQNYSNNISNSNNLNNNFRKNEKVDPSDLPLNERKVTSNCTIKNEINSGNQNIDNCNNFNQIPSKKLIRHVFSISIEKLLNLNVISKLNGKAFLKFKFLGENEYIKSDTLLYSHLDKEKSIIELDMQTSHSIISDRVKDYLQDFTIFFCYLWNDEEHVFGKVSLPSEELCSVLNRTMEWTLFIYGTEIIDRRDCIIGKMKIKMNYSTDENEILTDGLINERQIEFNRKIPKNVSLNFNIFYLNFKKNLVSNSFLKNNKNLLFFYLSVEPFYEDKNLQESIGSLESTKKKYQGNINAIFDESLSLDFTIDNEILEYMKNKYVYIHLNILKNKAEESFDNEWGYAENSERKNKDHFFRKIGQEEYDSETSNIETLGSAKVKFVDILTHINHTCEELVIFDNNDNEIATLNLEIKLDKKQKKSEPEKTKKLKKNKSQFKEVLKNENEKDGIFFFIINLENLLLDEKVFKKISITQGKKFFMMFTLGKNIKKMTDIYNLDDMLKVLECPALYIHDMNFIDITELKLSFSKKSPEDLFHAFYESIFEIKLFIKTENENKHIGSFMIDLSKLFSGSSRISSKVFFSQDITIDFYDMELKSKNDVKLGLNFTLFKSDLLKENFCSLYADVREVLGNNLEFFKNNLDSVRLKKILPNMLKDSYKYLDYYLFNLEDDDGRILIDNFISLFKVFTTIDLENPLSKNEYSLDWVNVLFTKEKKLEWTTDHNTRAKYFIKSNNIKDPQFKNSAILYKKTLPVYNSENFGVYSHNYNFEDTIDILDFILKIYKIYSKFITFENNLYNFNQDKNLDEKENIYSYEYFQNNNFNSLLNSYKYDDTNQYDNETLWKKLHQNTETIKILTKEIDLENKNNLTENFHFYEKTNPFILSNKIYHSIEKEKENFEDKNSSFNMSIGNFSKTFNEDKILHEDKSTLQMNINHNLNREKIISINSSFDKDEIEIITKGPKTFSVHDGKENEKAVQHQSIQANQSMFETMKRPLNFKKPPSPALNKLYKNADKNFLNRIQNILKKKDNKKLSYATSEESN